MLDAIISWRVKVATGRATDLWDAPVIDENWEVNRIDFFRVIKEHKECFISVREETDGNGESQVESCWTRHDDVIVDEFIVVGQVVYDNREVTWAVAKTACSMTNVVLVTFECKFYLFKHYYILCPNEFDLYSQSSLSLGLRDYI